MGEPHGGIASYCPQCGTEWTPGMAYCVACGSPAEPLARAEASGEQPLGESARAAQTIQTDAVEAASTANAATPATPDGGRRCAWCGAISPADADQCARCGAVFPRPEQDEAIQKASVERIRAANDAIAAMRRQRARRGIGRLFDR